MKWLQVERTDGIVRVRLARGKTHALDAELVDELGETFAQLARDTGVRAVILSATGERFFCNGLDVSSLMPLDRAALGAFLDRFIGLYTDMYIFPRPLVVAINGHAMAGGLILALTGDYQIVGAESCMLGLTEVRLGLPVPMGAICMLSALVGAREAHRLALTGEPVLPEAAYRCGLIHEVTSSHHLVEVAETVASDLAATPTPAFARTKAYLRAGVVNAMRAALERSREDFLDCWFLPETRAALEALVNRAAGARRTAGHAPA